jgi:hypothetical protein
MFARKDPEAKRLQPYCRPCHTEYRREHYLANAKKYKRMVKDRLHETRNWLRALKATLKCEKCGENHPAALQFHHRDPKQKDFVLVQGAYGGHSKERILAEIAKCDVLCANCHFKLHWELRCGQGNIPV